MRVTLAGDQRHGGGLGDGVLVQVAKDSTLRDRDQVTAIDGVAIDGAEGRWRASAQRPGDRLVYQVVRGGQVREEPVTLRRAPVAHGLLQSWGTILFVVALFVVVAYLYARRPGPATGGLLVLGSGLLSSDLAVEIGVSAVDARGNLVLWLYLFDTQLVYVIGWAGLAAFMARFLTATDPIGRQQLKWLAGGAFVSGTLALVV
jgi:hypothetical protein